MNKIILSGMLLISSLLTSCYSDYETDYEMSVTYFASQRPLRTLVADTNMSIKVGVAIGGKREVDVNDWATFEIDPTLLDNTSLTLLPEEYYELSDPSRMEISNPDLAIADVKVTFKDDLYNDVNAAGLYYALPLRITDHNQDAIGSSADGGLRDYTIVAIKYISQYDGTYFLRGKITNEATSEVTEYTNVDLSACLTRDFKTVNRNTVFRPGLGNTMANDTGVNIEVSQDASTITITGVGVELQDTQATLTPKVDALPSVGRQPKFTLKYSYENNGVKYCVEEELIRRQSPALDLRFEEWSK